MFHEFCRKTCVLRILLKNLCFTSFVEKLMFHEFRRKTDVLRILLKNLCFTNFEEKNFVSWVCTKNFWVTGFSEKIIFYQFPRNKICAIFRRKNIFLILCRRVRKLGQINIFRDFTKKGLKHRRNNY